MFYTWRISIKKQLLGQWRPKINKCQQIILHNKSIRIDLKLSEDAVAHSEHELLIRCDI
jgi:hypothetical protein